MLAWLEVGEAADQVDSPQASHTSPTVLAPTDLTWTERPTGVKVALLHGDPNEPGPFTIRLQYPPGYRKTPHFHPRDAYVTVLSGGYYRGYGTTFDKSKGIQLTPGVFSVNPGGVSHYEWTTKPAVLQVSATGPWETIYVDADGQPLQDEQGTPDNGCE